MLRRLSVRPGLTCLWQIRGRSDLPFDEWMRLDLEYVERLSFWLDLKILVLTVPAVLSARGAY
jgi:lipopolysaccharide/colanic/teichoic acid biosynthesis glycosyltransferase